MNKYIKNEGGTNMSVRSGNAARHILSGNAARHILSGIAARHTQAALQRHCRHTRVTIAIAAAHASRTYNEPWQHAIIVMRNDCRRRTLIRERDF